MSGVVTGSTIVGIAALLVTMMGPSAPSGSQSDTTTVWSQSLGADALPEQAPIEEEFEAYYWSQATLGQDSAGQPPLFAKQYSVTIEIARGDTLMAVLQNAEIDRRSAYNAIEAMTPVFDPRDLRPKQTIEVVLNDTGPENPPAMQSLRFSPDSRREITVTRNEDGETFDASESVHAVTTHWARSEGVIENSLYVAARESGVPLRVLGSLINIFSFDVDFQREIQPGDRFALLFSEEKTEDGTVVDYGDIAMAEMTVAGVLKRFYRFEDDDGFTDYYDEKGQSVRRALLRTPVEGARISSGYGKRRHPVLGYTKMHKGLDFAAPTGTPIFAAGDGVVEVAGWNGSFGRYIRIRHNGTYKTAYAHLSRIDSRVKVGARVQQRQIIGYVGSSGRSTGPHLHYEVHVDGRQVNPLGVKLPTGKRLSGAELARFQRERASVDTQYASLESRTQLAKIIE